MLNLSGNALIDLPVDTFKGKCLHQHHPGLLDSELINRVNGIAVSKLYSIIFYTRHCSILFIFLSS